jgi:hypothetical protein
MVMDRLNKLIETAGLALGQTSLEVDSTFTFKGPIISELVALLKKKNGFYAFESSLHVFPFGDCRNMNLGTWNSPDLWKNEYGDLTDGLFFFGEDIFGNQFCLAKDGVFSFDPETAKREKIAPDLEGWADCILTDFNYLTGYPLAHEWQEQKCALAHGYRLVPKIPFVCGGKYEIANLVMLDAVKGMKWRGELARQTRDLPDGSQINFKIINQ